MNISDEQGISWLESNLNKLPVPFVNAYIREFAQGTDRKSIVSSLCGRYGSERLQIDLMTQGMGKEELSRRSRFVPISQIPLPGEIYRIWYGLYPGKLHLLIGESGAGKSSLWLNIAIMAARNEELWGERFGLGRPARILAIDPENSGGINRERAERIGEGVPDNLLICDGQEIDLSRGTDMAWLYDEVEANKADLLFLDPAANIFGTENENDASEAARQMKSLTALTRSTGCGVVLVHHTSKDDAGSIYGRGSGARLGACDVAMVFRARGGPEDQDDTYRGVAAQRNDVCRLQIGKDRPCAFGKSSMYLRMAGQDRFAPSTWEEWREASKSAGKRTGGESLTEARQEIRIMLADGKWYGRQEVIAYLRKEEVSMPAADAALRELFNEGEIVMETRGRSNYYQLSSLSFGERNTQETTDEMWQDR